LNAHSGFFGYAAALADGEASYLLWIVGAFALLTWLVGLNKRLRNKAWYRAMQAAALLALPALLIVGMAASMTPVA
jgi:hypothetical protein